MSKKTFQEAILDSLNEEFFKLVESLSDDEARTTLGLNTGHSEDDLKSAYRKSSKLHHPDTGGSAEKMRKVNAAYEKLKGGSSSGDSDVLLRSATHPDSSERFRAARHPGLKAHHIHAIFDTDMKGEDSLASSMVMDHPGIEAEHLDKAMKHWDEGVRERALKHPKSEERHIDACMGDADCFVRRTAISHPKVKMRHIEKALQDEDDDVRKVAIEHLRKRGVFKD